MIDIERLVIHACQQYLPGVEEPRQFCCLARVGMLFSREGAVGGYRCMRLDRYRVVHRRCGTPVKFVVGGYMTGMVGFGQV